MTECCSKLSGGKRTSKRSLRSSAKRAYRKRIKKSGCKGLKTAKCRHTKGCKMALGKKRSFCRKQTNKKLPRYNLRSRKGTRKSSSKK